MRKVGGSSFIRITYSFIVTFEIHFRPLSLTKQLTELMLVLASSITTYHFLNKFSRFYKLGYYRTYSTSTL